MIFENNPFPKPFSPIYSIIIIVYADMQYFGVHLLHILFLKHNDS